MRTLLLLATVIPSLVYAAAPEDFHYYAIYDNNKVVAIEFSPGGGNWNDGNFIYRNNKSKAFSFCWSSENHRYFSCSQTKSTLNAVVYRKGSESDRTHREAMKLFKRNIKLSETGGLQEYYVCEKNCSSSLPKYIFNVGDSGC